MKNLLLGLTLLLSLSSFAAESTKNEASYDLDVVITNDVKGVVSNGDIIEAMNEELNARGCEADYKTSIFNFLQSGAINLHVGKDGYIAMQVNYGGNNFQIATFRAEDKSSSESHVSSIKKIFGGDYRSLLKNYKCE